MTEKQNQIYKYILSFHKKHGEVPSTNTTAGHFDISRQRIQTHYDALIRQGKLKKNENIARFLLV